MRVTRPWLFPLWLSAAVAALLFLLLVTAPTGLTAASTIRVPSDQPTIQAAIDSAVDGDTVLVAPGTYQENIDFHGKAIAVTSEQGPEVTIIDGNQAGPVVTFLSGEGPTSVINGFTLRNGKAVFFPAYWGGGIRVESSSPAITGNVVTNNSACAGGGGIGIPHGGSPTIRGNVITNNHQSRCHGAGGGGIHVMGDSDVEITDNFISNNSWNGSGAGVWLNGSGAPTIKDNVITDNTASCLCTGGSRGGGISITNFTGVSIVQNLIVGNSADQGGGISWHVFALANPPGPTLVSNTIADNRTRFGGSGVFAEGFDSQALVVDNIIVGSMGQTAVSCGALRDGSPPILRFNNVFSPLGTAYGGICTDQTGINGNISADPLFVDPSNGDYHLQPGSPSIDAGDNSAPNLPSTDLDGDVRILDGDGDGQAVVDMGVDEAPGLPARCSPGNTGRLGPTAEAADTGGDGDGFEVKPTYAFTDGEGFARNIDGAGDRHRYYNYGFLIGSTCSINGIQVHLDWGLDGTAGRNSMSVELSWDGGASWTAAKTDTTETASAGAEGGFHTATLGSASDTWGHAWTVSELSDANFRVRVTADCSKGKCKDRDYFLDWVAVKVNYGPQ